MARLKKTTAKRGRPPKNAVAKKRGRPRKVRDIDMGLPPLGFDPQMPTQAQRDEGARYQALSMAIEARKLTQGVPASVDSLIEDAEKIRKYLSEGIPEADPVPDADPNVGSIGSDGMTLAPRDEDEPAEGDATSAIMRSAQ